MYCRQTRQTRQRDDSFRSWSGSYPEQEKWLLKLLLQDDKYGAFKERNAQETRQWRDDIISHFFSFFATTPGIGEPLPSAVSTRESTEQSRKELWGQVRDRLIYHNITRSLADERNPLL